MASASTSRIARGFICQSCRQSLSLRLSRRSLSSTSVLRADEPPGPPQSKPDSTTAGLSRLSQDVATGRRLNERRSSPLSPESPVNTKGPVSSSSSSYSSLLGESFAANLNAAQEQQPHKLHVYSTKHNTHIVFAQPPKSAAESVSGGPLGRNVKAADHNKMVTVLLSLSTGNIGFKKSGRGSYDAAFQLAAFVLNQIRDKGMLRGVRSLEVVLRGFGAGREAVTKAILGTEGRRIRGLITAVSDATRLKLGGPRSKKMRRLG